LGKANKKQNPSNGRRLPRWRKFWNIDIRQELTDLFKGTQEFR
jgi:hypothetical protein